MEGEILIDIIVLRMLCISAVISIFMIFHSYILYYCRNLLWPLKGMIGSGSLTRHISEILMLITNGKHLKLKVNIFMALSIGVLVIMSKPLYNAFQIKGLLIAAVLSLMPYAYIRMRLKVRQISASYEGQMLLSEFVNQYKICDFNIYETVNKCSISLDENTVSSKALFQLSYKLRSYSNRAELQTALNSFILNWDNTWARMLAQNIYNAAEEKINVLQGLDNVLALCKSIKEQQEKKKRKGLDTAVIVNVLCPLFFFAAIVGAKEMMGYDWKTF